MAEQEDLQHWQILLRLHLVTERDYRNLVDAASLTMDLGLRIDLEEDAQRMMEHPCDVVVVAA